MNFFESDSARVCQPTDYADANGAYVVDNGKCWWRLRSPGGYQRCAAGVRTDGDVSPYGDDVDCSEHAVRPAIWVEIGE